MRKVIVSFREAAGLFYKDRYRTVFEVICNLVVSILLVLVLSILNLYSISQSLIIRLPLLFY